MHLKTRHTIYKGSKHKVSLDRRIEFNALDILQIELHFQSFEGLKIKKNNNTAIKCQICLKNFWKKYDDKLIIALTPIEWFFME